MIKNISKFRKYQTFTMDKRHKVFIFIYLISAAIMGRKKIFMFCNKNLYTAEMKRIFHEIFF